MSRTVRIKFASKYREPILDRAKRATIRYGFNRPISTGDYLHLLDANGDWFASATVKRVIEATAFDVAEMAIDGHRAYRDVFDLLNELRHFYPDATLTANTDLTAIEWSGAHPACSCENYHGVSDCCLLPEPKDRTGYQRGGYPR